MPMRGKTDFNKNEFKRIEYLIGEKNSIPSEKQEKIRRELRKIGFYISDFKVKQKIFTLENLNDLMKKGKIRIKENSKKTNESKFLKSDSKLSAFLGFFLTPANNALSIATVHATILSMIIAFITAYGFYFYGKKDDMETKIYAEAIKINDISFAIYGLGGDENLLKMNNQELRNRLVKIVMSESFINFKTGDITTLNLSERGEEVYKIMLILSQRYPFPSTYKIKGNSIVGNFGITSPERVTFENINDVRKWLEEVAPIVKDILWVANTYPSNLNEIISSYENKLRKEKMSLSQAEIGNVLKNIDSEDLKRMYLQSFEPMIKKYMAIFIDNMIYTQDIVHRVSTSLFEYDSYLKINRNNQFWLTFTLSFALISLVFGVLIPIFNPNIWRIFLLIIPTVFYVCIMIFLISRITEGI